MTANSPKTGSNLIRFFINFVNNIEIFGQLIRQIIRYNSDSTYMLRHNIMNIYDC